ncbi:MULTISPECIES: ABC transporter permease [Thermomonosporaceae]|uniref:ABC transporter permease n=1 Tax=Thermomonosporaceae TaxID=2012 RepID=UPI00255AECF7|nr:MULTISPECIES: ABC transporter permease [Thermomonosporaceae]MDL4770618.1 ABC transporter permease subunit [Actinomadura xylanilytica]
MATVVAAEWWKLRTVRSTYWILAIPAAFVGLMTLLAVQVVHIWDGMTPERRAEFGMSSLADQVIWVAGPCLAVLGVLAVTSEYRSGMIRVSLTAVPQRRTLLMAKAATIGAVALGTGLTVALATFFITRAIVGDRPIRGQSPSMSGELPGVVVGGASVAVYALLGLALAVLLRSTAGAIVSIAFLWHILPVIVVNVPAPWDARIGSVMLSGLAAQVTGDTGKGSIYGTLLPPGAALVILLAYAVVPLAAAAYTLGRRDA